MSLQEQVTDNVRVLAAARGTTPTRAARSVGMSAERLHAKLQARVRWNVEDLELMARALDVEPEQLVSVAWWPALRPRQDSNLQPTDLWSMTDDDPSIRPCGYCGRTVDTGRDEYTYTEDGVLICAWCAGWEAAARPTDLWSRVVRRLVGAAIARTPQVTSRGIRFARISRTDVGLAA